MHIVLRSPLVAGLAAVIGAGTLAIPRAADVALAAFDSPITEALATISTVNNDIFNGADLYADYEWQPYQGFVPQFVYDALPVLSQLVYNVGSYIGGTVDALTTSGTIASDAVWNLPRATITAAGQAISGDVAGAVTTLTDATLVPLQAAISTTVGALSAVLTNVVRSVVNLALAVPGIAEGLVNTTVGSLSAVVNAAVNIGTQTLTALSALDAQTAWNVVVDGLLGPVGSDGTVASSLPGTIEAVTIGPGLGPLGNPNGYQVPSLRMWAEKSSLQIANAIGATYPVSAAAAPPASAARKPTRSGNSTLSAEKRSTPSAEKSVKRRSSRAM